VPVLWQAAHSSAACGEARRAAASNGGGMPGWRLPVRRPASWQAAHSSEPGRGFAFSCWAAAAIEPAQIRRAQATGRCQNVSSPPEYVVRASVTVQFGPR